MPRLNQKKVITLKAKIIQNVAKKIEVNPSIRLTAVQMEIDNWMVELREQFQGSVIEIDAEGLV